MNALRRLTALSGTLLFLISIQQGCGPRPAPQPLPLPTTLFTVNYYIGSPLSGPVNASVPGTTPADSLTVNVSFIALENSPTTPFKPVGSTADFFSSTTGGDAVLPVAELTRGATFKSIDPKENLIAELQRGRSGRTASMVNLNGALPGDVTADFKALDPNLIEDPVTGTSTRRCLEIMVSRGDAQKSQYQIALVVKDLVKQKDGSSILSTEKAIFNRNTNQPATALVVPFRFDDAISKAVAIVINVSPGTTDPAHIAATTNCLNQLAAQLAATQPTLVTGEADSRSTLAAAVQSLKPVSTRRSSLAFLADQTRAAICEDLAMEADDAVLAQLVHDMQITVADKNSTQLISSTGWLLDHSALELLAKLSDEAANGTAKLQPELSTILTVHTGEVGRHPSSLDEVLRGLSSRQELNNRLIAENTIFLEDSNPASRVRAYDWLNARQHAPPGYDPLGTPKDRREALDRFAGTP